MQRRALELGTFAAALTRSESACVPREMQATTAWGSKQIGTPVWEHATVVPETGAVLVWLWHA